MQKARTQLTKRKLLCKQPTLRSLLPQPSRQNSKSSRSGRCPRRSTLYRSHWARALRSWIWARSLLEHQTKVQLRELPCLARTGRLDRQRKVWLWRSPHRRIRLISCRRMAWRRMRSKTNRQRQGLNNHFLTRNTASASQQLSWIIWLHPKAKLPKRH